MGIRQLQYRGETLTEPPIIQGGMGVSVSSWELASAVSENGGVGIVSGTGIGVVLVRDLNEGDPGGHRRRSLVNFPNQNLVRLVMDKYFRPEGREGAPYDTVPMLHARVTAKDLASLANVLGAYSEVTLAAEGGHGNIGMNLLTKVEEPNPGAIYGALLSGKMDYLIMGAGIPTHVPDMLADLSRGKSVSRSLDVVGGEDFVMRFDPREYLGDKTPDELIAPRFFPIVSAAVLAKRMMSQENRPDGFVIEGPTAGGHNAPPRVRNRRSEDGQLLYGPKDEVDLGVFRALGAPFYLAGGYGTPEKLQDALDAGASGIQVGTAFALANESGMDSAIRQRIIDTILSGKDIKVYTDGEASPTGYPFKVAEMEGTLGGRDSEGSRPVYRGRPRNCSLGYLRERVWQTKRNGDRVLVYRCSAEPVKDFVSKGGSVEATIGSMCLCNGLFATAGQPQKNPDGTVEPPVITIGDDINRVVRDMGISDISAADVMKYLTRGLQAA